MQAQVGYSVYIVKCSDETLYTGITKDINRRLLEHNSSPKGSKYTRSRRPVNLVYLEYFGTRSDAAKEESRIKKLSRQEKIKLISNYINKS